MPLLDTLHPAAPDLDALRERYAQLHASFTNASSDDERIAIVRAWDRVLRRVRTWQTWVSVRFSQNTLDPDRVADQGRSDQLKAPLKALEVGFKRLLVESPHRPALESVFGTQAFACWTCDLKTVSPEVEDLLAEEARLVSEYSRIVAGIQVDFQGKPHNLSQLSAHLQDADRDVRYAALRAQSSALYEHGDAIEDIFDRLVKVRHQIATTLGFDDFVALGYQRMQRVDYNESDVTTLREEVRRVVVPALEALREAQAKRLGVDALKAWDLGVFSPEGNPTPGGDATWMKNAAQAFFRDLDPRFAAFYQRMLDEELLDLEAREGKSPGGYCNVFYDEGMPFIFANFNGTTHDISVFTHEMGHAFQVWTSRETPLVDYTFATYEAAEIPSMSLEYLTLPYLHHFLGDRAEDFVWIHLARSLHLLPRTMIGAAWQHRGYRHPEATKDGRRAAWAELTETFDPGIDAGDLKAQMSGRGWFRIGHFFFSPFYFIDYALAGIVAQQLWGVSLTDRDEAMQRYMAVCASGGERAFRDTVAITGVDEPFVPGCLDQVVEHLRDHLGLAPA